MADGEGSQRRQPVDEGIVISLVDDITRWLAASRVDDEARSRSRQRWLRQQAEECSTIAGVMLDLAERGLPVVLASASGRRHRGYVSTVGADFVVLATEAGHQVVVADWACGSVRTSPGERAVVGDRPEEIDVDLAAMLQGAVADRPTISVSTVGDETITGELRAAGIDVLTLRLHGEQQGTVYVPLASVAELTVASG